MSERQQNAKHIKKHASKRLRRNLQILSVVYAVLFVVTLYDVFVSGTLFSQVIIAVIIGLVAGIVSSRMYKISWDAGEEKVVGRIDIYGIVVLALFIVFELNRSWIAHFFASGTALGSLSLVLVTSALFGRMFGTAKKILRVLRDEAII